MEWPVPIGFVVSTWPSALSTRTVASVAAGLAFNPVRLVMLIAWLYVCMYCVQRLQFAALIPKRYLSIASVLTLAGGPVFLAVLFVIGSVTKGLREDASFWEAAKSQARALFGAARKPKPTGRRPESRLRLLDASGRTLDEIYGHGSAKRTNARILDLTEQTIAEALDQRASDLLIDPQDESTYTVRLRIDGVLRTVSEIETKTARALVNSVKAIAGMDIAERRRPQDGAFVAKKGPSIASFRVASAGVLYGEKLSVRVLNKDAGTFKLHDVGFAKKQNAQIAEAVRKPSGMILICGPTGSGKTTTMYAMLNEIDRYTRNVITVEDPIEAVLPRASQIEINPKAEITFAKTLRSVLRQDPDVISVGEIRDEETAEIALRAAQTGHLVLATIHCNSNATALVRLLDLGVSPMLLSSGLSLVMSQRLLRRLCKRCRRPATLSASQLEEFERKGIDPGTVFEAVGCRRCDGTGYLGRTAICDIMVIDEETRSEIATNAGLVDRLRRDGERQSRIHLRKEGLKRVVCGRTSLKEVKRVVG